MHSWPSLHPWWMFVIGATVPVSLAVIFFLWLIFRGIETDRSHRAESHTPDRQRMYNEIYKTTEKKQP